MIAVASDAHNIHQVRQRLETLEQQPPLISALTEPAQPEPMRLAAVPSEVRNARRHAKQVLEDFGFDPVHAYEISLVVSELVTNAVRAVADHGIVATPDDTPIVLLVECRRRWTHIYVTDPVQYMSKRPQVDPLEKSGRGLGIVNTYGVCWPEYRGASGKTMHVVVSHPDERLYPIEVRLLKRGVLR